MAGNQQKDKLRQLMIRRAQQQSTQDIVTTSEIIERKLLQLPVIHFANVWCVYASTRHEVQTTYLIEQLIQLGKVVLVPGWKNSEMIACRIFTLTDLIPGKFNIPIPKNAQPWTATIDITITPGLAFDQNCLRLGRGLGTYDKFLNYHPPVVSVGLAFDWQIVDKVPTEQHDIPLNYVLTEQRLITAP